MLRLLYNRPYTVNKRIKIHVTSWILFICYEVFVSSILSGFLPFFQYFIYYVINICLFYVHASFLTHHLSKRTAINLWWIPIFTITELSIYIIVALICGAIVGHLYYNNPLGNDFFNKKYFSYSLYRGIYFIVYSTGYYFLINFIQKQQKVLAQAVENEKLQTELIRAQQDFLRAQINPHLLFNTLSFIKYAARKNPAEADEAMLRLSSMMGFALDNTTETILLTTELEQVENIIRINQLRFNHTLHINFVANIENKEATIIPIILLTLVENIFKHGQLKNENHPVAIHVSADDDFIRLHTSNLMNQKKQIISNNKGLINIDTRLKQRYHDHYEFLYETREDLFIVDIKISIQNNYTSKIS